LPGEAKYPSGARPSKCIIILIPGLQPGLDYWHICNDEGQVDPNQERVSEHQDGFVQIAQDKGSVIDDEEDIGIQDPKGPLKKFLRIGRWRKIMQVQDEESGSEGNPPPHPTSVSDTVTGSLRTVVGQKMTVRYCNGWKRAENQRSG
jgi:hypothetical protein